MSAAPPPSPSVLLVVAVAFLLLPRGLPVAGEFAGPSRAPPPLPTAGAPLGAGAPGATGDRPGPAPAVGGAWRSSAIVPGMAAVSLAAAGAAPGGPLTFHRPFPAGPFADAAARSVRTGHGTTYYVAPSGSDSNPCLATAPCRQVARALGLVVPGDTVDIANGSYMGFNMTVTGTPGAPISLVAPGGDATFSAASCYIENCDTIYLTESSWAVLDGLRVYDSGRAAIRIDRSNHITLTNLVLGDDQIPAISQNNAAALFGDLSSNLTIEYSDIFNATMSHGIYLSACSLADVQAYGGNATCADDVVRNNVIDDNNWTGIQIAGMENGSIEQNILFGNGNGGAAAISLRDFSDGRVVNNLIYGERSGGIILYGCCVSEMQPMHGDLIADNTVLTVNGGAAGPGRYDLWLSNLGSGPPTVVRDNILFNVGNGWAGIVYNNSTDLQDSSSGYNLVDNITGPNGTTYPLAAWQAMGHEADSISAAFPSAVFADPSAEDYRLANSSPALGAGIGLASVPTDLLGNPRPTSGASDIGCYETSPAGPVARAAATAGSGPLARTVAFTSSVTGGSPPYSYLWGFGDGSVGSTLPDPTHTYAANGTYRVLLEVHDSSGRSANASVTVTAGLPGPLLASATAFPRNGTAPLTVAFAGSASGGTPPYTAWSWSFGDGARSLLPDPSHTYTVAGTFSATLNVTDTTSATARATVTIVVLPPPLTVVAVASPRSGVAPLNVSFEAVTRGGSPPYAYSWKFGDGTTSASASPTHRFLSAGQFAVGVVVHDSGSPVASSAAELSVGVAPGVTVGVNASPAAALLGEPIQLTAVAHGGSGIFASYIWSGLPPGCAAPGGSNGSCAPASAGSWNVTVEVVDSLGHTGSGNVTIVVTNGSLVGIDHGPPGPAPIVVVGLLLAGVAAIALVFLFRRRRSRPR